MAAGLRDRILDAVGSVLRPSLECAPQPGEVAIVDAVMEALADTGDVPARVAAQVHLNRPLPPAAELFALRRASGLTQEQVGAIVGVSSHAVGQWERGVRSPQRGTLERARYLRLVDVLRERREGVS